jgi:hypothetical protein
MAQECRSRPRHPIRAFAVNEVADDIERAPSVFTFISQRPRFREIAQKRIESSRSPTEKQNRVLQIVFHRAPQFADSNFLETLIALALLAHISGHLRSCLQAPSRGTRAQRLCNAYP